MAQEPNPQERARELVRLLVPDWHPTTTQVLWAIRITIVLVVLIAIGYAYGITLWDWAKLLIVPAAIAGGVAWFNRQQQERGLENAERRAQDEALQAYLDKMTELLVVYGLGKPQDEKDKHQGETVRTVAWARTKTMLRRLDGARKGAVLRFLTEAKLIQRGSPVIGSLAGADLVGANLKGSVLRDTALQGVDLTGADLKEADLSGADLSEAVLHKANLHKANLHKANLRKAHSDEAKVDRADLSEAELWKTELRWADLRNADLHGADLTGTRLFRTDLGWANLSGATLRNARLQEANLHRAIGITNEQVEQQTLNLRDATMPNGQKYEDWLKSKGSGEDGENTGPS